MAKRKKQSRFYRQPERVKILALQKRDLKIFQAVLEEHFLTTSQIQQLFFSSYQSATRRLQKLWNAGYLQREYLPVITGSTPIIYCPNKVTVNTLLENNLIEENDIKWKPRYAKITPDKKKHEIEINEIKIALISACKKNPDVKLLFCSKGKDYWDKVRVQDSKTGQLKTLPVCPDRFFIIQANNQKPLYYFLEHDRGTMNLGLIRNKMLAYYHYFMSGEFYKKYGNPKYPKQDFIFKVLFTAPTERRKNNLTEQCKHLPNPEIFCFTVYKEFLKMTQINTFYAL